MAKMTQKQVSNAGGAGANSLESRSTITSAISTHVNSYSYLSERVYDYFQARSAWINRVQQEEHGIHGIGSEEAALKRLPTDFESFFAIDTRKQPTSCVSEGTADAATRHADASLPDGETTTRREDVVARWSFELVYRVSSNRAWDRLYLLLGLSWSILAPARMDGALTMESQHLAYLALMMFASAAVPATLAVFLKAFFFETLRARLRDDRYWAGVFFVLATKSIPVPSSTISCCCDRGRGHDGSELRVGDRDDRREEAVGAKASEDSKNKDSKGGGGGGGIGRSSGNVSVSRRYEGQAAAKHDAEMSKLPPRHWMCCVCKKVNAFPSEWDGKTRKMLQVIIKRKAIDKQAMFAVFNTKPSFPLCSKCQTPFDYTERNRHRTEKVAQQSHGSDSLGSRMEDGFDEIRSGATSAETAGATGAVPTQMASKKVLLSKSIRNLVASTRNSVMEGGYDYSGAPELWYGRKFRRQLEAYFKPQLERPSLSTQDDRYPEGARVECFAGKTVWYPGTVAVSRENNTYDVSFDNGDVAQHVFPHTVRFQSIHTDCSLVCCFYGLALAGGVIWPLAGLGRGAALAAIVALLLGVAGALAVVVQFCAIFRENREAGPWIPAWFAVVLALPWASLGLLGGLSIAKVSAANSPSSVGSWVKVLFLPAVSFSLTGGGYAHAVSPVYGKAWAAASLPWLLFLLLASLHLDGEVGDASPAAPGDMKWLGVFSPLWIFVMLVMAGHHVLPYVWDVQVFPPAGRQNDLSPQARGLRTWLSGLAGTFKSATGRLPAALRRVSGERGSNSSAVVVEMS